MEHSVSGVCRLSCAFHAACNSPPDVKMGDTDDYVYAVQVRWFDEARDDSAAVVFILRACVDIAHTGQAYSAGD